MATKIERNARKVIIPVIRSNVRSMLI